MVRAIASAFFGFFACPLLHIAQVRLCTFLVAKSNFLRKFRILVLAYPPRTVRLCVWDHLSATILVIPG